MKPIRPWLQLSPRGTARERYTALAERWAARLGQRSPAPADPVDPGADGDGDDPLGPFFRRIAASAQAHDLGDESLYLAEELVGLGWGLAPEARRALALLVLASMISARQGSTRLPLDFAPTAYLAELVSSLVQAGELELTPAHALAEIDALVVATEAEAGTGTAAGPGEPALGRVLGRADDYSPLIVADGCLYQHRMYSCESALAARLHQRIAAAGEIVPAEAVAVAVAEVQAQPAVVAGAPIALSSEQTEAVRAAVASPFTVISGGPGTGKTAIVAAILRVLVRLGEPVDAVALAAPTGKAANRMWASIRAALQAVPSRDRRDDELLARGVAPQTLHRLLAYVPGVDRFQRHENNPLRVSTVIVDEASMIDLALMERLLCAVPVEARLILLGDADQLPSVDAGAVLRDLVAAGAGHDRRGFARRLTRSYRMDPSNPAGRAILSAAAAIDRGDDETLFGPTPGSTDAANGPPTAAPNPPPGRLPVVTDPATLAWHGIELLDTGPAEAHGAAASAFAEHWYQGRVAAQPAFQRITTKTYHYRDGAFTADDARDLSALFALYENSRLLTVTRRQDTGAEAINRRLHRRVLAAASAERSPDFYPGEPVMMRRNDYERGLFNGDQGIIVRVSEDDGPHRFRVVFPHAEGYAVFHLDALRAHIEHAFAVTVHKSQGSEFDEVAVILPSDEIPLLTRGMLYTAVTRARRAVVLVGAPALVRVAARRPGRRHSGLGERLGAGFDTAPDQARHQPHRSSSAAPETP
ncbi:ATP-dependent DNA helicase [Haliangium sp.]|uniref:ATP-dependent DNA helicase n=1 Tax=Haliangium sp. TaxID=2663208 RepID=UPI003D11C2A1